MNLNRKNNELSFNQGFNRKNLLILVSMFLLIGYGIFNARNLIIGPKIEILSPTSDKIDTEQNIIKIKGRAKNIVSLSMNERHISVDTNGFFEEKLILYPGTNIIEIKAKDRFKKEARKEIRVYYSANFQEPVHVDVSNISSVNKKFENEL